MSGARIVRDVISRLRWHPYPVVVALWTGAIFAERFAVDQLVVGVRRDLRTSLASTSVVFCFLAISILMLLAMLVDRRAIARGRARMKEIALKVVKEVVSPLVFGLLAGSALVLLLARGALRGEQISQTLVSWLHAVVQLGRELVGPEALLLIGAMLLVTLMWFVIHSLLRRSIRTVAEAIQETIVGSYFVLAGLVFYGWIYFVAIWPHYGAAERLFAATGFVKDAVCYGALAIGLVVGTYKAGSALRALTENLHRWMAFWAVSVGVILFVLAGLWFEFSFKDNILLAGESPEYRTAGQQALIATHIMIRDFGLIIPLMIVAMLRFLREVETVNREEAEGRHHRP